MNSPRWTRVFHRQGRGQDARQKNPIPIQGKEMAPWLVLVIEVNKGDHHQSSGKGKVKRRSWASAQILKRGLRRIRRSKLRREGTARRLKLRNSGISLVAENSSAGGYYRRPGWVYDKWGNKSGVPRWTDSGAADKCTHSRNFRYNSLEERWMWK